MPASATRNTALWTARFRGAGTGAFGRVAAVSPSGSTVFVTGAVETRSPSPQPIGLVLADNAATGALLWRASYHPIGVRFSNFFDIAVSPDGSMVFATGTVQRLHQTQSRFLTVAYNATTGARIWADTEGVRGTASKIAVSPDGFRRVRDRRAGRRRRPHDGGLPGRERVRPRTQGAG